MRWATGDPHHIRSSWVEHRLEDLSEQVRVLLYPATGSILLPEFARRAFVRQSAPARPFQQTAQIRREGMLRLLVQPQHCLIVRMCHARPSSQDAAQAKVTREEVAGVAEATPHEEVLLLALDACQERLHYGR